MSTLKSSAEDLTLNADGSGNDIKFQSNGVEKASIDQDGLVTCAGATMSGNIAFNSDGIVSSTAGFMQLSAEDSIYLNYDTDNGGGEAFNIRKGTTARFTIDNAGDVAISAGDLIFGTAGKGIVLGATTNTDANTLEDYEEGVHVVTATDQGGGATYGLNASYNTFAYTKIGRLVTITGTLVNSTVTGTPSGTIQLSLPFACVDTTDQAGKSGGAGISVYQVQKYTSGVYPQHSIAEGASVVSLLWGVVDANIYDAYFNTSSQVYCNFSYFTA